MCAHKSHTEKQILITVTHDRMRPGLVTTRNESVIKLPDTTLKDKYNHAIQKSFENGYSRKDSLQNILCKV